MPSPKPPPAPVTIATLSRSLTPFSSLWLLCAQSAGMNSRRICSVCSPIAGTGPRTGDSPSTSAGGAMMEAGPPGVSTGTRRSAGCVARSATLVDEAVGRAGLAEPRRRLVPGHARRRHRATRARRPPARLATRALLLSKPGRFGEVRLAQDRGAELRPFALVLDRDQHQRAVAGREGAVGADRRMREARRASGALPVPSKYSSGTFIQSAMPSNRLTAIARALAGDAARDQRLQHGRMRGHAAGDVADRDADPARARPGGR